MKLYYSNFVSCILYIAMHIIANSFLDDFDHRSVSLDKSDESSKKTVLSTAKEGT